MNAKDFGNGGAGMAWANSSARMVGKLGLGAAAFVAGAFGGNFTARATMVTVLDPSPYSAAVEAPYYTYTSTGAVVPGSDTVIPDWGVGSLGIAGAPGPGAGLHFNWDAPAPSTYCDMYEGYNTVIYQDVGALLSNTTYNLSVFVLENSSKWGMGTTGEIALFNTVADSNTLTQSAAGSLLSSHSVVVSDPGVTLTTSYTTGASVSGDLTIELLVPMLSPTNSPSGTEAHFTNVSLNAVPEPASLGLLGVGGLGLLLVGRKRNLA